MNYSYSKELKVAIEAAQKAGRFLLSMRRRIVIASYKSGSEAFDFSTTQDLHAEKLMIQTIHRHFPSDNILSEETLSDTNINTPRIWIIDPIDGTKNYFNDMKIYSVAIALYEEHNVQVAVVFQPGLDELYTAVRGHHGVRCNRRRVSLLHPYASLKKSIVNVGFPHHRTEANMRRAFAMYGEIVAESTDIMRTASAVYDTCMVATGRVGGYVANDIKPWDIAAGMLFIQEQSGVITGAFGEPLSLFHRTDGHFNISVVAAKNKKIHQKLLRITSRYFPFST